MSSMCEMEKKLTRFNVTFHRSHIKTASTKTGMWKFCHKKSDSIKAARTNTLLLRLNNFHVSLCYSQHLGRKKEPLRKARDSKDKWTGALTRIVVVHTSPVSTMFAASVCSPSVINHHCVFHRTAQTHQYLGPKLVPKKLQKCVSAF